MNRVSTVGLPSSKLEAYEIPIFVPEVNLVTVSKRITLIPVVLPRMFVGHNDLDLSGRTVGVPIFTSSFTGDEGSDKSKSNN